MEGYFSRFKRQDLTKTSGISDISTLYFFGSSITITELIGQENISLITNPSSKGDVNTNILGVTKSATIGNVFTKVDASPNILSLSVVSSIGTPTTFAEINVIAYPNGNTSNTSNGITLGVGNASNTLNGILTTSNSGTTSSNGNSQIFIQGLSRISSYGTPSKIIDVQINAVGQSTISQFNNPLTQVNDITTLNGFDITLSQGSLTTLGGATRQVISHEISSNLTNPTVRLDEISYIIGKEKTTFLGNILSNGASSNSLQGIDVVTSITKPDINVDAECTVLGVPKDIFYGVCRTEVESKAYVQSIDTLTSIVNTLEKYAEAFADIIPLNTIPSIGTGKANGQGNTQVYGVEVYGNTGVLNSYSDATIIAKSNLLQSSIGNVYGVVDVDTSTLGITCTKSIGEVITKVNSTKILDGILLTGNLTNPITYGIATKDLTGIDVSTQVSKIPIKVMATILGNGVTLEQGILESDSISRGLVKGKAKISFITKSNSLAEANTQAFGEVAFSDITNPSALGETPAETFIKSLQKDSFIGNILSSASSNCFTSTLVVESLFNSPLIRVDTLREFIGIDCLKLLRNPKSYNFNLGEVSYSCNFDIDTYSVNFIKDIYSANILSKDYDCIFDESKAYHIDITPTNYSGLISQATYSCSIKPKEYSSTFNIPKYTVDIII